MRLLRYVFLDAVKRLLAVWVVLALVVWTIDLVEASAFAPLSLALALARLPIAATYALPMSAVLGPLLALSRLGRQGEWDAVASTGIPPSRLAAALLLAPLAAVAVNFVCTGWLVPLAVAKTRELYVGAGGAAGHGRGTETEWMRRGERIIGRGTAAGCDVELKRAANGAVQRFVHTCAGGAHSATWQAGRGWQRGAAGEITVTAEPRLSALLERATPLNVFEQPGGTLKQGELEQAIAAAVMFGRSPRPLRVEAALRTALDWSCFSVAVLALAIAIPRRHNRPQVLVAIGVLALGAYWLAAALAWNLATAGSIAAGWLASGVPLVFALLGGCLIVRRV